MSYNPPQFGDFGKGLNDLLKKKFDFKNQVTIKRATSHGLKVETGVVVGKSLDGSVKLTYKEKGLGEFEASNSTSGVLKSKAKFTDLSPGVTLTVESELSKTIKITKTVDYKQDHFSGRVKASFKEADPTQKTTSEKAVSVAAAVGWDGISIGGEVSGSSKTEFKEFEKNFGFNFAEDDFSFSLQTEQANDKSPIVSARFFQKVNADLQSGFKFDSNNVITIGSEYKLDKSTVLKHSICTKGVVQSAINHTLSNPSVQLNLAAEFNTENFFSWSTNKYGLGFTLGDL
jgi:hypothetical protein